LARVFFENAPRVHNPRQSGCCCADCHIQKRKQRGLPELYLGEPQFVGVVTEEASGLLHEIFVGLYMDEPSGRIFRGNAQRHHETGSDSCPCALCVADKRESMGLSRLRRGAPQFEGEVDEQIDAMYVGLYEMVDSEESM